MSYIILIWIHFIADFIFQTDEIATNKSTNIKYLTIHCLLYGLAFLYFGVYFALITCILHFMVDFVSSKLTTYLLKKNERHWFFVTIGADQAIHMTCLFLLLQIIG